MTDHASRAAALLPLLFLLLPALPVLAACSEEAATATSETHPFAAAARAPQTIDDAIGRLVPRTASGMIHIREGDRVRKEIARITRAIAPGFESLVDIVPMVDRLGLRPRDLDLTRPGAVVLTSMPVPMMGGFLPIFALPMQDADEAADLVEAENLVSGDYLAVSIGEPPQLRRKPAKMLEGFPAGDLAVRLQLLKVLQPLRPAIQKYLDPEFFAAQQPEGQRPSASQLQQMKIMLDGVKGLLGTARVLDLGVDVRDGSVTVDAVLEVAQGSSWDQGEGVASGDLAHFGRSLGLKDPAFVAMSTPIWSKWMDAFRGVYQDMANRMDPGQGQAFVTMVNRVKATYDSLRVGVAAGVGFTAKGMQTAVLFGSESPEAIVGLFHEACDELDAKSREGAQGLERGGGGVKWVRRRLDLRGLELAKVLPGSAAVLVPALKPMLGGREATEVSLGIDGQRVGLFIGGEAAGRETMVAARGKGVRARGLLATVLPRLHAAPELLVACDVRKLLRGWRAALPEEERGAVAEVPAGEPVLVWVAMSSGGTRYEVQMHVDVVELMGLARLVGK